MPKGTPELTERRKNEILDACENIYQTQGFTGVTIKTISTEISLTRPAIYHYFETKEEILLGLLVREYDGWCSELEKLADAAGTLDRRQLSQQMAHTLETKEVLLRILNMNLFEIEQNSRLEHLAGFKRLYQRSTAALTDILHSYKADISRAECEEFCETFSAFLFGVYPFAFHTKKQKEAMKLAGMPIKETSIYEMINRCLLRLIP